MPKTPNVIDVHVGSRIRIRRTMIGMSQERLGASLGVTFQQVQKYEKGTNRVGASRLQNMAAVLSVPISYFFDGSPGAATESDSAEADTITRLMNSKDCIALAKAFVGIEDKKIRQKVLALVRALSAENAKAPQADDDQTKQ